jgi:hypothetical protein
LALVNALFHVAYACGLKRRTAWVLAAGFCIIPQSLYFEHLYHYEHLVAALLVIATAAFHAAVRTRDVRFFLGFFVACAVVGWFRSTFHLVWFAAMLVLALWFGRGASWRRVLGAAAAPAALLFALYLKNWALFGVFGSTSAVGGNLTHVTVSQLAPEERELWVSEHKISPFATLHVYSGPAAYLPYYPPHHDGRSPVLDALERPTVNQHNFNHWVMVPVMAKRGGDALAYIRERPLAYLRTVFRGMLQVLGPATEWHPGNGKPGSAHYAHQQKLGWYADAYNAIVHAGPGIYVFLPLPVAWAVWQLKKRFRTRVRHEQARMAVIAFALFQIAYVFITSALFTIGESARYRHQVEALIWLVTALWVANIARSWTRRNPRASAKASRSRRSARSPAPIAP